MSEQKAPIIVKRIRKVAGGHHGGAWKIAYADFVTAMMAFFLLMWLLGSTSKGDLNGIAEYFKNPLKVSMSGGDGSGDSSSVIKGGGADLTRKVGQVKRGETEADRKSYNLKAAQAELGILIAAALVGTFLGILLAYGFVAPLSGLLEQKLHESSKIFQCVKVTLLASINGYAPAIAVEFGRKVLFSTERPSFAELETHVKGAKSR